jgi:hypothetical protein
MSAFCMLPFSPRVAGHIILALVVLATSLAWLPPTVQAAPAAETSAAVVLNAHIFGQRLYIKASGLPHNHVFAVRVRRPSDDDWARLARVKSNNKGALEKAIRLPRYLARAPRLNVCLKDMANGRLYCTRARRR